MKTLNTIQKLCKIGKVLSKIVFIFSVVGAIFCLAEIVSMAQIPEGIKLGGVTVRGLIEKEAGIGLGTGYVAVAAGMFLLAGDAVVSKMAERYFGNEIAAGTPFTFEGAKELKRLGICEVCIPLAIQLVAEIAYQVAAQALNESGKLSIQGGTSIGLGVMLIVASLLCRHGAEISAKA